jgi:hypothetical protein
MQRAAKSAGRFEAMSQPRNAGIEMHAEDDLFL